MLPQLYSSTLLSKEQAIKFFKLLKNKGAKFIVFSGLLEYALSWIREIYKLNIKFGVVKKGLKETLEHLDGVSIHRLIPVFVKPEGLRIKKFNDKKIHIGIFGNSSFNKNRHTQVLAASLLENSLIHIIAPNEFGYAVESDRIITHENLNKENFLQLLGSTDINLYVSYSESWGQIITESISLGVPCLASNNSGVFFNKKLRNILLVDDYDNPFEIANQIKLVLGMDLKNDYLDYLNTLNFEVKKLVDEFKKGI